MKDYSLFLVVLLTHKGNVLCVPLELEAVKLHLGCLAKSCFALKFKWCRLNRLLVKILACFVWDSEFCFVRCMLSGPYFVCRFESIRGSHRGMCSWVSCACCNRDLTIYHPLCFFIPLLNLMSGAAMIFLTRTDAIVIDTYPIETVSTIIWGTTPPLLDSSQGSPLGERDRWNLMMSLASPK